MRSMRGLILFAVAAGLLLLPAVGYSAEYGAKSKDKPPISQPLVREGDYAVKLVGALKIGNVTDETKAEDVLAAAGIAPKSGWISDFPVTPEIVAQVQVSVETAANGGKIPLGSKEADVTIVALNKELGLSVVVAQGKSAGESAEAAPQYNEPAVINNYYYDEGPPIVTYYAPPPDYWYLYAWDPWPFWCGGFFFPGFFVLVDFDRVVVVRNSVVVINNGGTVIVNGKTAIVSNHVIDPVTKASVRIDPVSVRPTARTAFTPAGAKSWTQVSPTKGLTSTKTAFTGGGGFNRTSANNILRHSVVASRAMGDRSGGAWSRSSGGATRGNSSVSPSIKGGSGEGAPSVRGGRSSGTPGGGRSFGTPGGGRSFNSPGGDRSFSAPSMGSRSFSGGSRSFSGGGGFSGGGSRSSGGGGGFRGGGGGFGGGGGCRGKC